MHWEAISTIADVVAAIAVVVSLIYLAAQIRHNSRQIEAQVSALRLQSYDSAGAAYSALRLHISSSSQIASVWRRAKDSYSTLEPDEKAQANELFHEYMWAYQNIFLRMEGGATDESYRELAKINIRYWMRNPGFREWWRIEEKTPYSDELEALVNSVCSSIENESN